MCCKAAFLITTEKGALPGWEAPLLCGELFQRDVDAVGCVVHPDEDRSSFAADDGAGRMERAGGIGAGEDACTIERVDLIAVGPCPVLRSVTYC